mmetsp:Transcript_15735/g.26263  ORF Transcript_15735/g.26263 Transcript_15735/m.26263 type:complete len:418 (+) Transcript_15735:27-1280(+)
MRKTSTTCSNPRTSDCPRYTVDLDTPPEERWLHVIRDFSHHFPVVIEFVDDIIGTGMTSGLITSTLTSFNANGKVFYSKELEGIAAASGMDIGKIALLQIAYEFFAACTSVVVDMPCAHMNDGKSPQEGSAGDEAEAAPFHIRTMDWSLDVLKPMTIEVDFTRGGRVITTATTWAGYVGVLTGMKPGVASVSVNYRRTVSGESWLGEWDFAVGVFVNAWKGLCRAWPVAFLVREVLMTCDDFSSLVGALESSSLMAPTYITVAGALAGEGQVITRDRDSAVHPWLLRDHGPIAQTNMDHFKISPPAAKSTKKSQDTFDWQDICCSRYRERAARLGIRHMASQQSLHPEMFWALFSHPPCLAEDTVYTVAMCPQSGMYVTRKDVTSADKRLGRATWKKIFDAELSSFSEQEDSGARRF